jgi:hypothetical protein
MSDHSKSCTLRAEILSQAQVVLDSWEDEMSSDAREWVDAIFSVIKGQPYEWLSQVDDE